MPRKITDGPLRNKDRTKKKLIDSVGSILKKEGFAGLNISKIAAKANLDRKLIYDYFGGVEGLIKEYLNTKDYWKISSNDVEDIIENGKLDFGKEFSKSFLEKQFDDLMENAEMRRIITWELSENSKPLKELVLNREQLGERILSQVTDEYFKDKDKNFRAIEAILVSSVYFLTLQAHMNGSTFCGIDIKQKEGQAEIKKALKQIIDWAYT
ncbi:TetR/AcrR family transcriptional regulator [Pedobacter punctiformis]|uniref:TetR/AcrR family transcriptional regulator n=1 Tax=Pedobacter punctiformis TaxID=3004097 RepID=A0ABT4L8N7_9SPHI|nr:TetR/AcrR family transcriptional regulator [Pedobacter sp. HCMS5-2]MCZ4243528.1 TetR/AcrR family transcriptional regulator [Pedobacter sp. HCMS5-2]